MKKNNEKSMVKVSSKIHKRVSKRVAGTKVTIGEFFDEAAIKELKRQKVSELVGNVITQPKD